ncbi:glycosyltransferase family 4 protein [Aquariibacter albus]|uniref:Glycosyltransferase family 1 protein n=1 Tax=Aquariibacter albus TaxID=2759899 RepID=A0A839HQQ6_9BURK|nr:glycosyltransferase family 1 protein [Aquariibacter albus]MBB1161371.1 glycosyltransferase family 1 protein [Aquariibacter albus]
MHLVLVSDAWAPQVNGVVITLVELVQRLRALGHRVTVIEPGDFRTFACPGYPEIRLAWRAGRALRERLDALRPDALHLATEGPLGWAARRHALRRGWAFTTAFHTRFPDILAQALKIPSRWGYALFRRFHAPSAGVMVPTEGMLAILQAHGFAALRPWTHGVDRQLFRPIEGADLGLPRPVWLYVGRVSWEKNLEAFLDLDLPGSKVVYGVGPREAALKAAYPQVHWRGIVAREQLPAIYSAADAFVFPSRSETFGLVMLEALACGTPVAAYPEAGPLDVIGREPPARSGGVLDPDLRAAALAAAGLPREAALARAAQFDWDRVTQVFLQHLRPCHAGCAFRHETVADAS